MGPGDPESRGRGVWRGCGPSRPAHLNTSGSMAPPAACASSYSSISSVLSTFFRRSASFCRAASNPAGAPDPGPGPAPGAAIRAAGEKVRPRRAPTAPPPRLRPPRSPCSASVLPPRRQGAAGAAGGRDGAGDGAASAASLESNSYWALHVC